MDKQNGQNFQLEVKNGTACYTTEEHLLSKVYLAVWLDEETRYVYKYLNMVVEAGKF